MLSDHCVIATSIYAGTVLGTRVWSPATLNEELSASRVALIKAGWCNMLLCLMSSA